MNFLLYSQKCIMNLDINVLDETAELTEEIAKRFLESGVHFGQVMKNRSPKMDEYVYGIAKNGIQIINLDEMWNCLKKAGTLLRKLSAEDKNILFVGTNKKAVSKVLEEFSESHNLNYMTNRWLGGTLTNPITRNRIGYLRELEGIEQSGLINSMTAKEKSFLNKKLKKLKKNLGGLKKIKGPIHAIVIIDPMYEINASLEAFKKSNNLSILALADTDCRFSPDEFNIVIPCNVSSICSLKEVMSILVAYIEEGRKEAAVRKSNIAKAKTTIKPIVSSHQVQSQIVKKPVSQIKIIKQENQEENMEVKGE